MTRGLSTESCRPGEQGAIALLELTVTPTVTRPGVEN